MKNKSQNKRSQIELNKMQFHLAKLGILKIHLQILKLTFHFNINN